MTNLTLRCYFVSNSVDGRNVTVEYHWAEGNYDQLPWFATDLVDRKVAAIVSAGAPAALAAKNATTTIPIVFLSGVDPVRVGIIRTLNRPGGNITGIAILTNGLIEAGPSPVLPPVQTLGRMLAVVFHHDNFRDNHSGQQC